LITQDIKLQPAPVVWYGRFNGPLDTLYVILETHFMGHMTQPTLSH